MTVMAFITEAAVVQKILSHLGLPQSSPPLSPARLPAQSELELDQPGCFDQPPPGRRPPGSSRDPPAAMDGDRWVDYDPVDPAAATISGARDQPAACGRSESVCPDPRCGPGVTHHPGPPTPNIRHRAPWCTICEVANRTVDPEKPL